MSTIFIHPAENWAATGTLSAETGSVSADPRYGLAMVADGNAATPCMASSTGPFAIQWDLGSARQIDAVFVPMHNFQAGLNVRFQAHSSASWGTPSIDRAVVVPAWLRTLPPMPKGLVVDLRNEAERTFRYVRLYVPVNNAVISIGEVVFGRVTVVDRGIKWEFQTPEQVLTTTRETPLGARLGYRMGTLRRSIKGTVPATAAGREALRDLYQRVGDVESFAFALDPTLEGLFVYWDSAFAPEWLFHTFIDIDVTLIEQSRGRPA